MAVITGRKTALHIGRWNAAARASALLLVVLLALAAGAIAAYAAFDGRAIPGVRVGGVPVGGLAAAGVRATLSAAASGPWAASRVHVAADGRTFTTTNGDLGIAPDIEAATAAALGYGRTGDPLQRAREWVAALLGDAALPFVMRAEGDRAQSYVAQIASTVDAPAVDGELALRTAGVAVTEPVTGRELDRAQALSALLGAQALGDRTVELTVRPRHPAVDEAGLADALAVVRAATTPVEVSAGDRGAEENAVGLTTLLTIERRPATAGDLSPVPAGAIAPATRYQYVASLDEARVRAWAIAVGAALDRPAKSASYTVAADGSLVVVPSHEGVKIDVEAFVAQALRELVRPVEGVRPITPSFVRDVPVFTTEQAQQYRTSVAKVTTFETFFPVQYARWKNISTGAAQFNNVVIAPGQTFSFWELIGPVTVERGYAYAGAIVDGVSDPNIIGGGLCQVSTTLFMAVAQAGYEIVERGSHSYYIDRYPLGLDAAVFDPGLDLKWKNDTKFPVLLRSSTSNIAVEFEIWTVPTGRTVAFSDPVQSNWRDVAPGQKPDPAFVPGSKVLGRTVTRTRTVSENGAVIHADVFRSYYAPVWGGPAEATAP